MTTLYETLYLRTISDIYIYIYTIFIYVFKDFGFWYEALGDNIKNESSTHNEKLKELGFFAQRSGF